MIRHFRGGRLRLPPQRPPGLVPPGGSSARDCCCELGDRATAPEAPRGWGSIPNFLRWGGGSAVDEPMLVPRSEVAPLGVAGFGTSLCSFAAGLLPAVRSYFS